jgi:hypothetical protein
VTFFTERYIGTTFGQINAVAIDSQDRPYFTLNPYEPGTATVMALSADASVMLFSASFKTPVQSVALDGKGGIYGAGTTYLESFFVMPDVYQPVFPGDQTAAYAAKFDLTTQTSPSQFTAMVMPPARKARSRHGRL